MSPVCPQRPTGREHKIMAKMKLTQAAVEKVSLPKTGRDTWWDTEKNSPPGFGLRVSASGHKSWFLVTRLKTDEQIKITLGTMGTIPKVDAARQHARDVIDKIRDGYDPRVAPPVVEAPKIETVGEVFAEYIERYAKVKNKHWKAKEDDFRRHIAPKLGSRDIASITPADVRSLRDNLTSNRRGVATKIIGSGKLNVHRLITHFFNWSVAEGYVPVSPAAGVKVNVRVTRRDRVLSDAEVVSLWHAAASLGVLKGGYVKALLLTAQRRTEVAEMRWSEVDLEKKIFTLPPARSKNKKAHAIPLAPQLVEIVAALPRLNSYVLPGRGTSKEVAMSGFSKLKLELDEKMMESDSEAFKRWTFHDLRRTASTRMAELGVLDEIIGRVLNHAVKGVTAQVYIQHSYLPERRVALEKWANYVERLLDPAKERDNVIPFAAA